MLTGLHIQDFVLIDQINLPMESGLTALTGETGAGKSILLDALGLATGGRAERGAIRQGAEQGIVSAIFEPDGDHLVWRVLEENGLHLADDEIILRRVQSSNGKSRAFINDQPVSIGMLKKVGGSLVEIHGQHDGQGFLTASTHRELLDEFGGLGDDVKKLSALWGKWRDAEKLLADRKAGRQKALAEADYLRHVTEELQKLDPKEDEEKSLATRRAELMASEKVREDLAAAMESLSDGGLEQRLAVSARRLVQASAKYETSDTPLDRAIERIEAALSEVMEARSAVEDAQASLGADPGELEMVEERLFALRAAARKHGVSVDQLPGFFAQANETLSLLDEGEAGFDALTKSVEKAQTAYERLARKISTVRTKTAEKLNIAVAKELAPLKLGKAVFSTDVKSDIANPTADGIDQVEFLVATNPGAPAGPLKTIASGGELSRFVLAMKAALAAKESRTVIIFDEVDAGVGGAVADAVGERLARLAHDAQVLVVTHSPQVAARAAKHWQIEKTQRKTDTTTSVQVLNEKERIEELARMLSGAEITKEARAAAKSLLRNDPKAPASQTKRLKRA